MLLLIKEFFERVDFGNKSADIKIATNITQHAKSVPLKCILERCETAIKNKWSFIKHLKLGVSPNWALYARSVCLRQGAALHQHYNRNSSS